MQDVAFVASNAVKNRKLTEVCLKEPKWTIKKKQTLLANLENRTSRIRIDQIPETSLNLKLSYLIKKSSKTSKRLKLKSSKSLLSLR